MTLQVRSVRTFWRRYLLVIKGSFPMVVFILVYVFYFSWMGNRLFSGTIEGVQTFSNLNDSFWFMFVCLTTSNYPDVMLPSYAQNRLYCIFFITYLIVGLFLLMNLLLAIFYSNYQEKADASLDNMNEQRSKFFIRLFRQYDKYGVGELDRDEVFEYLKEINSLYNRLDEKSDDFEMTEL